MRDVRAFCKRCRYELSGLSSPVCPECGRPFDLARRRTFTRHPRLRAWRRRVAVALLAVLGAVAAYVGSYYCVVDVDRSSPQLVFVTSSGPATVIRGSVQVFIPNTPASNTPESGGNAGPMLHLEFTPAYRIGGEIARDLYRPMHAIDRMLRPGSWSWDLPGFDREMPSVTGVLYSGPPREGAWPGP